MTTLTPAEINQRNAQFWAEQEPLFSERMADEKLLEIAMRDMAFESARDIPLKQQKSLEQALADAADAKIAILTELARKGGRAAKIDALQELIETIVGEDPEISERALWYRLKNEIGKGTIVSIDPESSELHGAIRRIYFSANLFEATIAEICWTYAQFQGNSDPCSLPSLLGHDWRTE